MPLLACLILHRLLAVETTLQVATVAVVIVVCTTLLVGADLDSGSVEGLEAFAAALAANAAAGADAAALQPTVDAMLAFAKNQLNDWVRGRGVWAGGKGGGSGGLDACRGTVPHPASAPSSPLSLHPAASAHAAGGCGRGHVGLGQSQRRLDAAQHRPVRGRAPAPPVPPAPPAPPVPGLRWEPAPLPPCLRLGADRGHRCLPPPTYPRCSVDIQDGAVSLAVDVSAENHRRALWNSLTALLFIVALLVVTFTLNYSFRQVGAARCRLGLLARVWRVPRVV